MKLRKHSNRTSLEKTSKRMRPTQGLGKQRQGRPQSQSWTHTAHNKQVRNRCASWIQNCKHHFKVTVTMAQASPFPTWQCRQCGSTKRKALFFFLFFNNSRPPVKQMPHADRKPDQSFHSTCWTAWTKPVETSCRILNENWTKPSFKKKIWNRADCQHSEKRKEKKKDKKDTRG